MTSRTPPADDSESTRTRQGIVAALFAYTIWGFLPIYFKAIETVPSLEVLAHRIAWAVPFGALIIVGRKQWTEVRRAMMHRRTLALLALAAVFIAINWLVYIIAVQRGQIFQASLGYYINPLIYVLVGVTFLRETLRRFQTTAVILAAIGVAVLTFSGGEFPVVSLTLAVSFTIYGVIRSRVVVGGMPGLFIETLILVLPSLGYIMWLTNSGLSSFRLEDPAMMGGLMLAGPLTVVPLLCFALAARRLRLSTIGIMQFIVPTLQFLVGLAYGEQLTVPHATCFTLIWVAVIIFSWDAWRSTRLREPLPVVRPG